MKTIRYMSIGLFVLLFALFQGPAGSIGILGVGDSSDPKHPDHAFDYGHVAHKLSVNNLNRQEELKNFGSNIIDIRQKQGLSETAFTEKLKDLGFKGGPKFLEDIEKGRLFYISIETAGTIAEALGVPLEQLFKPCEKAF